MNTWPHWSREYLIPALVLVVVGASGFAVGANYRSSDEATPTDSSGSSNPAKDQADSSLINQIEATLSAGQSVAPSPPPAAPPNSNAQLPRSPVPAPVVNPGLINLNQASNSQLETLPGIGPVKAPAIIDYRQANGPFIRVDDLIKVKG
ncbi:MAG: helix-hairpin-helix domain-containing protein, partial [Patescibacteria group bacterium]